MLVIIYTSSSVLDHILNGIRSDAITLIQTNRKQLNIFGRIIRKLFEIFNIYKYLPEWYFSRSFLKSIRELNHNTTILIIGYADMYEFNIIKNNVKSDNLHIWYWNSLKKEYKKATTKSIQKKISLLKNSGFQIETFDKADSLKYDIVLRNQFYRSPFNINNYNTSFESDFFFIGYTKDRLQKIRHLEQKLKEKGYVTNFHIINKKSDELTYSECVRQILKSKCIVDINQEGQSGLTLRPLESAFFSRKLITNNVNIISEVFYKPDNIYIIKNKNLDGIDEFMNSKLAKISDEILQEYDINTWLEYYNSSNIYPINVPAHK